MLFFRKNIKGKDNIIKTPNIKFNIVGNNNKLEIPKNIQYKKKKSVCVNITGNDNTLIFGDNIQIKNSISINISGNNNKIIISNDVIVVENLCLQILEQCENGQIFIDEKTTFWNTMIQTCENNSKILIGKDCMFSYNTTLMNSDGHTILQDGKVINIGKEINISDHCWIGYDAVVYKNSFIGKNSIVGRGALVSGKFYDENVVLAGLPAKIIKTNINWNRKTVNESLMA